MNTPSGSPQPSSQQPSARVGSPTGADAGTEPDLEAGPNPDLTFELESDLGGGPGTGAGTGLEARLQEGPQAWALGEAETGRTDTASPSAMFTPPPAERRFPPVAAIAVVAAVLLAILAGLLLSLHPPVAARVGQVRPLDPYAGSLALTGLALSESTSLSGGKQTYLDGRMRNQGGRTVTGATAQVFFANDVSLPPQVETVPVLLVRTHEPYLDTQPIADAPLAPGDEREFRLIFESIGTNWNGQMPKVSIVSVSSR